MNKKRVVLRPGKEKALRQRHPWIFSGAIASGTDGAEGDILPVYSSAGEMMGYGYFNSASSILGRMVCFDEVDPHDAMALSIQRAVAMRQALFKPGEVTGYRVINGEGDDLPGLIVDRYGDYLVLQIGTLGMERQRDFLINELKKHFKIRGIYEKSTLPTRTEEGLEDRQEWLFGEAIETVDIQEYGLKYRVPIVRGQKTGFFLDQREMRQLVRRYAGGRKVLNCFAYHGAFGIAALAGGAERVTSVDVSKPALEQAKGNTSLNGYDLQKHQLVEMDVFRYLRQEAIEETLVILDPPAFAKRRKDIVPACRGYKDINRLAIAKVPPGSLLLTSSCSYFVDATLFQQVIFQAALEAKRSVRILDRHHYAFDHPVSVYHPEANYLKSFLLYID